MKYKKNKFSQLNNKYISQTTKNIKYKHVKKEVKFKRKLKSVKLFVPSAIENSLYTLRNKIVENKPIVKRYKRKSNTKLLSKFNNADKSEVNVSKDSKEYDKDKSTESSTISSKVGRRSSLDWQSKLKVLSLYDKLKSFTQTSHRTGISAQNIRNWKIKEDYIKEKAGKTSQSTDGLDFNTIEEVDKKIENVINMDIKCRNEKSSLSNIIKKETSPKKTTKNDLSKQQSQSISNTSFKSNIKNVSRNITNGTPKKSIVNKRQSLPRSSNKSSLVSTTSPNTLLNQARKKDDAMNDVLSTPNDKPNSKSLNNFHLIPNFKSLVEIVEEINKLSHIYESTDCLATLNNHFKALLSHQNTKESYDNKSLIAKTKVQDETFRYIISDFFQGEYKLLMEINHQFDQLIQKKSKNIKRNLKELKNYFHGSIQRLHVLKQQLG